MVFNSLLRHDRHEVLYLYPSSLYLSRRPHWLTIGNTKRSSDIAFLFSMVSPLFASRPNHLLSSSVCEVRSTCPLVASTMRKPPLHHPQTFFFFSGPTADLPPSPREARLCSGRYCFLPPSKLLSVLRSFFPFYNWTAFPKFDSSFPGRFWARQKNKKKPNNPLGFSLFRVSLL